MSCWAVEFEPLWFLFFWNVSTRNFPPDIAVPHLIFPVPKGHNAHLDLQDSKFEYLYNIPSIPIRCSSAEPASIISEELRADLTTRCSWGWLTFTCSLGSEIYIQISLYSSSTESFLIQHVLGYFHSEMFPVVQRICTETTIFYNLLIIRVTEMFPVWILRNPPVDMMELGIRTPFQFHSFTERIVV